MSTLEIKNLSVQVLMEDETKQILKGINLTIKSGETHAIMGPNGSGKSTLAYSIAGHPRYEIIEGEVLLDGENILELSVDERAKAGLFLAMQHPVEVPGVSVTSIRGDAPKLREWISEMKGAMNGLSIDPSFSDRNVNEGFSGGERKRHEILQLELIKPKFAVLDETDSGLDVDALKIVSDGVNRIKSETNMGVVLITHTIRLLRQIPVDKVHVIIDGKIVQEGGAELAEAIDNSGYEQFAVKA
jgi:Fe-S cluster assembly ATP-binding protein